MRTQARHERIRQPGNSPHARSTLPSGCIINISDFLEKAKSNVKEDGLLEDVLELKRFEKRMVSVFVIDKRTRKICRSTKITVI